MNKKLMFGATAILAAGFFIFSGGSDNNPSNPLTPATTFTHAHGLAVDVKDSTKVYIATHHGLFVLINDKDLFKLGKSGDDFMGFSLHPTNSNIFFSSGHPSGGGNLGFQTSIDGGVNWKKVSAGENGPVDFHAMAISPLNPNLIYGFYRGDIQRSEDQGKKWEIVAKNMAVISLVADPKDENKVYAATPEGILASSDKGATWQQLSKELDGHSSMALAINPQKSNVFIAHTHKFDSLAKSEDSGLTWKKIDYSFNEEMVHHIAFDTKNPNTVYTLTNTNSLYKSIDGGTVWVKIL